MTLIAALDCGDHLLFATDSMVTESAGLTFAMRKTNVHREARIAWGFAGDEGIGRRFNTWMNEYPIGEGATWQSVSDAAIEELSRLNGRKRELGQLAKIESKDEDLTTVLMAGEIGGALDVWELSDRGAAASVRHREFFAIGSGYPHAAMVFTTLRRAGNSESSSKLLGFVMALACEFAPMCGQPIRMLKITPESITELTS